MNITKHFTIEEVQRSSTATRLGINNDVPEDLMENLRLTCEKLEQVRALFNKPLMISSFYRGPKLNKAVGGSKTSAHMDCRACDFTIHGVNTTEAFESIKSSDISFDQLILESSSSGSVWIHLGIEKLGSKPRKMVMTGKKTKDGSTFRVENG